MRIILIEDEDEFGEGERGHVESSPVLEHGDPLAGISLQSLIGFTSPKMMKLEGEIEGMKVLVLIDSGGTSNFISTPLVHKLGKTISACKAFGVTLGTGLKVYGEGVFKGIALELQGITIIDEFFALELGSLDVILGVQWLERLGNVITNWRDQTMRFLWEGKEVELKGNSALKCSKISVKRFLKTFKTDELGVLIECNGVCL